jgi:hypothetical protein
MLTSRTDVEACARAGVSRSSLRRVRRLAEFQEQYQAAKAAQLQSAIDSLRGNANDFVGTLATIAADEEQHGNARVRAAEVGLNVLAKFVELEDIVRRLTKLEGVFEEGKN